MSDKDALGDRMKSYEALTTSRVAFKGQPFCIRLDGKSFSSFTRGLARPYDERLSDLMVHVTEELVREFGALVGYTQSDEITLGFYVPADSQTEYPFGGKFQKLESISAAFTSVEFNAMLRVFIPEKEDAQVVFDSRAFVVPNLQELYHCFLWRQQDAVKNSISMAASAHFPHKRLLGMSGEQKQELLFQEAQINYNDYPAFFKRGTFVQRVRKLVELSPEQLERIPEAHRPAGPVERSVVEPCDIWLTKTDNPVGRLFGARAWMDAVGELKRLHSQDAVLNEDEYICKCQPDLEGEDGAT